MAMLKKNKKKQNPPLVNGVNGLPGLVFVLECVVGLLVVLVFYEGCKAASAEAVDE
jgi:hypothetical protein